MSDLIAQFGGKPRQFTFDQVHGQQSSQGDVFASAKPIVDLALQGLNGTIFAYGKPLVLILSACSNVLK